MFSFCGMLLSILVKSGDSEFYVSPNSLYQFREVENRYDVVWEELTDFDAYSLAVTRRK